MEFHHEFLPRFRVIINLLLQRHRWRRNGGTFTAIIVEEHGWRGLFNRHRKHSNNKQNDHQFVKQRTNWKKIDERRSGANNFISEHRPTMTQAVGFSTSKIMSTQQTCAIQSILSQFTDKERNQVGMHNPYKYTSIVISCVDILTVYHFWTIIFFNYCLFLSNHDTTCSWKLTILHGHMASYFDRLIPWCWYRFRK